MKKVLLVIDVQNYFAVEKAANLPQKIAHYIDESDYEHVLFVKFRNDPASNFHTLLNFKECTEPPATDIHPALEPYLREDNVFEKTTYSALKCQPLLDFLKVNQVLDIDLCGISIDACILATTFEAFDLGYQVKVLDNLCSVSSFRDDYEEAAKIIIKRDLRRKDQRFPSGR